MPLFWPADLDRPARFQSEGQTDGAFICRRLLVGVCIHCVLKSCVVLIVFAGGAGSDEGDWSVVVLGVTVLVILCVCWYHRLAFPADFTPFSSLLLVLFTALYAFTIRGVVLRLLKLAFGCLRRPWGAADATAQSTRTTASARAFQEVPQRPPS